MQTQPDLQPALLSYVALGAAEPESTARFYRDVVGLTGAGPSLDGRIRLGWGMGCHVLELTRGSGLLHFGLELLSEPALERLAGKLARMGVATESLAPTTQRPGGLAFADPDGNRVEAHGRIDRGGERTADPRRRPIRLQHITLGSPSVARLAEFYCEALGFRISDRMGDRFIWMRSNREHHTVAVVEADVAGLDHYAYEVGGWEDLKTWCDELAIHGVPLTWGPGRHGPGNNLFVFFDDPDGRRIELSCEMERFWDETAAYVPRQWRPEPLTVNLWGIAPTWRDRVAPGTN
jgi:catechol 2,3-dioxygenase-like lactoylglutathione lyase family enzyme